MPLTLDCSRVVESGGPDGERGGVRLAQHDVVDLQRAVGTNQVGFDRRTQLGALGERVRVHADEVVALCGDLEAELAVGLGGHRVRRAVRLGQDHVDALDRVRAAAHGAGDAGGLVGFRQTEGERVCGPTGEQQDQRRDEQEQHEEGHCPGDDTSVNDARSGHQWVLLPRHPAGCCPAVYGWLA
jgi:hypothetical protein